jgi:hypothetical protein
LSFQPIPSLPSPIPPEQLGSSQSQSDEDEAAEHCHSFPWSFSPSQQSNGKRNQAYAEGNEPA